MINLIKTALENTPQSFPQNAVIACQGAEGAYSQFACEILFEQSNIMYFDTFNAVFNAVEKSMCEYGILPLENSLHGSVAEVYDLMRKYSFYITRSVNMRINHTLLANKDVIAPQIKEIYSHEQALGQCSDFIGNLKNVKIENFPNTATAARMVAESGRDDIAAIANPNCAELYGLSVISGDIQNNADNYTRFICISKELQIYTGADKISIMFTVSHKPGALYEFIGKFSALGINLTKLESRPIPGKDFEYMFYAEMDSAVTDEVLTLLNRFNNAQEELRFLGCYSENKLRSLAKKGD